MTRRNRRNPKDRVHTEVHENPAAYNRASRRGAGHRGGVHVEAMRAFHAAQRILPRAARRLMRDPYKAEARVMRNRAKLNRLLAHYYARST